MKLRFSLCTILLAGSLLSSPNVKAGQIPLNGSPFERQTTEMLDMKRYVAAGNRAYVVGIQDGSVNPSGIGWHITGQMGGVWAHPIKLLDHFQFYLNGQLLPPATTFVSGTGYVRQELPLTQGITITETQFAPDDLPVVLVGVDLYTANPGTTNVTLAIQPQSELIAAYPWSSTTPSSESVHQQDQVIYDSALGALQFTQPGEPSWYALVSAAAEQNSAAGGFQSLGATNLGPAGSHNGAAGELTYRVGLRGQSHTTIWFAISGSNVGKFEAAAAMQLGLEFPRLLLNKKISDRRELLSQAQIQIPDSDQMVQAAFDWAKLNLADMRRVVQNMEVRDTKEGTVYPPPINAIPIPFVSGFGAGYPDYPWFFGTDGCYTTFGLSAVGQWDAAKSHLNSIRQISQIVNGSTGKVLHEIVTSGSIYYGTNEQPGDTNETAEFATAVATLWRWSGDKSVRDDNYNFIKAGLTYITTNLVTATANPDGWPEGAGMVEATGMGAIKLDVAVYTIRALNDLAEMATSKGDIATHDWAANLASALTARFAPDWWIPAQGLFADSLALKQAVPTDPTATLGTQPVTQLEQLYWTNATPMETGIAPFQDAEIAFPSLESSTFTGTTGFYQEGQDLPAITGSRQASALNTGVMAVAEAKYGRLDESLRYVRFVADELDVEQPGALPELFNSPDYPYFPSFAGAMVMQAWSSYGVLWSLVDLYLGIEPNAPASSLSVIPDLPSSWPRLSIEDLNIGSAKLSVSASHSGKSYSTSVAGPSGWKLTIGYALPANSQVRSVTLNGKSAMFQILDTNRGREVHVSSTSGGKRELIIETN